MEGRDGKRKEGGERGERKEGRGKRGEIRDLEVSGEQFYLMCCVRYIFSIAVERFHSFFFLFLY